MGLSGFDDGIVTDPSSVPHTRAHRVGCGAPHVPTPPTCPCLFPVPVSSQYPPLTHHPPRQDLDAVGAFVREFVGRSLLPRLEERMTRLNASITATRRGLRNRLNRLWKGSGDERQADRCAAGQGSRGRSALAHACNLLFDPFRVSLHVQDGSKTDAALAWRRMAALWRVFFARQRSSNQLQFYPKPKPWRPGPPPPHRPPPPTPNPTPRVCACRNACTAAHAGRTRGTAWSPRCGSWATWPSC